MLTYTYISKGNFGLVEKPKPMIQHESDAIVKVTLASICSSDLHIKHGFNRIMLKDENGEPAPVYSVASGLDYPSSVP